MGQTILLADDSITIQKVIELTFSDEDFALHTVGNGQKAMDEMRNVKPDIVLCDIIMPEKNGYEVCEFIKTQDDLKHIPVLLLTGAFEPFDQERARKAGCDGFLAKPFEPQTLISKVRQLLESAGGASVEGGAVPPTVATEEKLGSATEPHAMDEGATVIDEGFAVEAGERELSVEAGDQTVLLGAEEAPTLPSEDIWSQVQPTPEAPPPAPEKSADDAATIYMDVPAEPDRVETDSGMADFDEFSAARPGSAEQADDGAWVLPSTEEEGASEAEEPELTPLADFSGFDDFSANDQAMAREPELVTPEPPDLAPPAVEPEPVAHEEPRFAPPAAPEPPPLAPPAVEPEPLEPEPPLFARPGMEPSPPPLPPPESPPMEAAPFAPPGPPSPPPDPHPEEAPISELPLSREPFVAEPVTPAAIPPEPTPVVEVAPGTIAAPQPMSPGEVVFDEADFASPSTPVETAALRGDVVEAELNLPEQEPPAAEPTVIPGSADLDLLADKVAERLVQKLSETAIKEIAWEVVPELAQTLIQKEIDALKAKIPK